MTTSNTAYENLSGSGKPMADFPMAEVLCFYHRIIIENGRYSHTWRSFRTQIEEEVARMGGGIEAAKIRSSTLYLSEMNRLNRNAPKNLDGDMKEEVQEGSEDLRDLISSSRSADYSFI